MPRKSRSQASRTLDESIGARWRFLLRNPVFQNDMQSLNDRCYGKESATKLTEEDRREIADKWGLLSIPWEAILYWPGTPVELKDYPLLERFAKTYLILDYSPVVVTELRDNRFLFLLLDLNHPIQDLLPLIEQELRQARTDKKQKRNRLDKAGDQIKVFDLAIEGVSFPKIAKTMGRRVSTVKEMFFSAARNVYGSPEPPSKEKQAEDRLLFRFDPKTHTETCEICKDAKSFDQFCKAMQHYANQDQVALREITDHRDPASR